MNATQPLLWQNGGKSWQHGLQDKFIGVSLLR